MRLPKILRALCYPPVVPLQALWLCTECRMVEMQAAGHLCAHGAGGHMVHLATHLQQTQQRVLTLVAQLRSLETAPRTGGACGARADGDNHFLTLCDTRQKLKK